MAIIEKIRAEMFAAVKDHDADRSSILQIAIAEINNARIDKEIKATEGDKVFTLSEEEEVAILRKIVKKLNESIELSIKSSRNDLVKRDTYQKEIISKYLPLEMGEEEIEKIIHRVLSTLPDVSGSESGRIIGLVMKELKGKASGNVVKSLVEKIINQRK